MRNRILVIGSPCVLTNIPMISNFNKGHGFFESIPCRVIEKYDESALMNISQVFGNLKHVVS